MRNAPATRMPCGELRNWMSSSGMTSRRRNDLIGLIRSATSTSPQVIPMKPSTTRATGSAAAGIAIVRPMALRLSVGMRASSQSTIRMLLALVDHGSEAATAIASQSAARADRSRSTSLPTTINCAVCVAVYVVKTGITRACAVPARAHSPRRRASTPFRPGKVGTGFPTRTYATPNESRTRPYSKGRALVGGRTLAKHHAPEYPNTEYVYPAKREFQQVGIEYARQNILDDRADAEPGDQSAAPEHQQMRYPQGKQQGRPDEAQLDGDLERLIMRLVGHGPGCPLAFAGQFAEPVENGAGAMAEHRRGRDQLDRLAPEFEAQPRRRRLVLRLILMNLARDRKHACAQMRRSGPSQPGKDRARHHHRNSAFPIKPLQCDEDEQRREYDKCAAGGGDEGRVEQNHQRQRRQREGQAPPPLAP